MAWPKSYTHFVCRVTEGGSITNIVTGNEYRSDAIDAIDDMPKLTNGAVYKVYSRKFLESKNILSKPTKRKR